MTADQAMINGFQKLLMQIASFAVASQNLTPAAIVQIFLDRIKASQAALVAEAARLTAVKAERDERAKTAVLVRQIRRLIQAMYSESPDTLATFGLKPAKAPKKTVATKAAAVAKVTATRKARHTMGSVQKKSVKGTVPAGTSQPASPPTPAVNDGPAAAPATTLPKPVA